MCSLWAPHSGHARGRSSPSQYHNNPLMSVETSISWSVQRKQDIFCVGSTMRQWTHSRCRGPPGTLLAPAKELTVCDQEQLHQNHSSSSHPGDQLALPSTEKCLRELAFPLPPAHKHHTQGTRKTSLHFSLG